MRVTVAETKRFFMGDDRPFFYLAWIIHENIYRHGLAADGGFHRPQSPLGVPKSVLEPIQRPKRMNMQLDVAELIRQKCS